MALSCMLRRASPSIVHCAVGSSSSRLALDGAISAVNGSRTSEPKRQITTRARGVSSKLAVGVGSQNLPYSTQNNRVHKCALLYRRLPRCQKVRILTTDPKTERLFDLASREKPLLGKDSTDVRLLKTVKEEIEMIYEKLVPEIPATFPFKIQDNPHERSILLTRVFSDENIEIKIEIPHEGEKMFPMTVTIGKGIGPSLECKITASPLNIVSVDSILLKEEEEETKEDPMNCCSSSGTSAAFFNFLETRGITPSTTSFLYNYMVMKKHRDRLLTLKKLKKFIKS